MPNQPGLACDIGAGSGRDAAWLAGKGWDVIAVEPAAELRRLGEEFTSRQQHQAGSVSWLDDHLPELKCLRALDQRFQIILISAVWVHLKPAKQDYVTPSSVALGFRVRGVTEEGVTSRQDQKLRH